MSLQRKDNPKEKMNELITSCTGLELLKEYHKEVAFSLYRMVMVDAKDIPQEHIKMMKSIALLDQNNRPHGAVSQAIKTFYSTNDFDFV